MRNKMSKKSAGLLTYRVIHGSIEVFLVHPGGPFWAKKDDESWSIPKGEFSGDENPLEAAKREVKEETGFLIEGDFKPLDPVRQPSGKIVYAWAVKSDVDAAAIKSNTFSVEWPPNSGKVKDFPEVDRAKWFSIEIARIKIVKGQVFLLDQLARMEIF
jgi:predicted NUDIX family NTP pyrophosphohydrolase